MVTMNLKRLTKHLTTTHRRVAYLFPEDTLAAIEAAISESENRHAGEIRFVVEAALDGTPLLQQQSARERALELFSQLRIWDTEHNNGLLVYLLLADRAVEIVADRGIDAKVGYEEWERICRAMESDFKHKNYKGGVIYGIETISQHLERHFPNNAPKRNELPDKVLVI